MQDNHISLSRIAQFIRRAAPFDRMGEAHLQWLAERFAERHYAQDSVLIAPGAVPDRLYFLRAGSIQLEAVGESIRERDKVLAELVQGESFPLEALHDRRPVFSTFRAKNDVHCLELSLEDFNVLQAMSTPFREFCEHRAAAFLDSSRRIFHAHFARKGEELALDSRLSLLVRERPVLCAPDVPVRETFAPLAASPSGFVVIGEAGAHPCGVFTTRDVLQRVLLPGGSLEEPVSAYMTREPVILPPQADGYEAALEMARHGVRQVLVASEQGELLGAVSERDLFRLQRIGLSQLSAQVRRAQDLGALSRLAQHVRELALNLMAQGVAAEQLTRIISTLNDHVTQRVIELEFAREPLGGLRLCWLAIGSEGRHEQTLSTDQDNGIVFEVPPGATADEVRERLLPIAQRINGALDACGYPLCKGNVMAGNPEWCLSVDEWKRKFSRWIAAPEPEALLNATIFFDFRPLYGERPLAEALQQWLSGAVPTKKRFVHSIVQNALQKSPPIGFFRDFIVDDHDEHPNTIDLKMNAAALFVDAARIFGLANGVTTSNTVRRLRAAAEALRIPRHEVEAWVEAFHFIQMLRLRRQHELASRGEKMHNRINPYELNDLDRRFFLEALRQARKLQQRLSMDFGAPG